MSPIDQSFRSDNCGLLHPLFIEAIQKANSVNAGPYLETPEYEISRSLFKETFGPEAEVYFVRTGTAANVIGIKGMLPNNKKTGKVYCSDKAHIIREEAGALATMAGSTPEIIPSDPHTGKISVYDLDRHFTSGHGVADYHHSKDAVISVTQADESGKIYTPEELLKISEIAHKRGMYLHMDGARLCYAAAALGVNLKFLTTDCGIDVLYFGGKKLRVTDGEAIVVLNKKLNETVDWPSLIKSSTHMDSNTYLIAAQFNELLKNDFWRILAKQANSMALRLWQALENGNYNLGGATKPHTNQVFVPTIGSVIAKLEERYGFYIWEKAVDSERLPGDKIEPRHAVRLVTSPTTVPEKVDELATTILQIRESFGFIKKIIETDEEDPDYNSVAAWS